MGNRRKLVVMILLSMLTLLMLLYIQINKARPHGITVMKIETEISHVGGGQNNDSALNDRQGVNWNDKTEGEFDVDNTLLDMPGREKGTRDGGLISGDKFAKIDGRKDDHTTGPNIVDESDRSQHASRERFDVRSRDGDAVASLVDNSHLVANHVELSDAVVKDSKGLGKVAVEGTTHHDDIAAIGDGQNDDIADEENDFEQNIHLDIHAKGEDDGHQGNDVHVLDVGEIDQQTEDHIRKQASREFMDPDVSSEHIEREIVDLDEYKERREELEQENGGAYDWTVHMPRSHGFVEPIHAYTRSAGFIDHENDVVTETTPPAPSWLDTIPEGEFKTLVDEFGNEDLRFGDEFPEWFSRTDIIRMEKLSTNEVIDVFEKEHHPRLRLLVFNNTGSERISSFSRCTDQCGVQKSIEDWYEIVAFHLDRVLGLNRSLPTVASIITGKPGSDLTMDERFTDRLPRPVIWWDPDIQHGGEFMIDQNSLDLSWTDYQRELRYKCNAQTTTLRDYHCQTEIKNIEWSKLAMFDFLLQIHDRLDRNCCGYDDDEGERCMVNGMHDECDDVDKQFLVHIMAHKYDATRLVFIDNAGHNKRSKDHLNYRLLKGIQEFPENSINILRSGNFRDMMKRSLTIDRWFWIAVGGDDGVDQLVDRLEERVNALLDYIDSDENIRTVSDY